MHGFVSAARWARALVLVAFLVVAGGCGERAAPALLVETADPVTVNGQAVHVLPSAPLSLSAGDRLEVGAKGLARLLYPDGSRFLLMARGADAGNLEITPRASSAAPVVVKLVRGVLAFLVPKDRAVKDRYELQAVNTVTTIEGTAGRVITSAVEDRVALEHGAVTVTALGGTVSTKLAGLQETVFSTLKRAFDVAPYDPLAPAEQGYYGERATKPTKSF